MDFNNVLTDRENIDRSSKVFVMDAISRYSAILHQVAYAVTALPSTQARVERLFSTLGIIRLDLRISKTYWMQSYPSHEWLLKTLCLRLCTVLLINGLSSLSCVKCCGSDNCQLNK